MLDFHPTASQGVYVSFDESTKETDRAGSLIATPGKNGPALRRRRLDGAARNSTARSRPTR